jgi:hypothetical protein
MLAHPYLGLFHDANLYTLQALARLHPDTLAHDVFLGFGSQDRFTIFSPLYAAAIRWLGVDHAAALLTLVSQFAFFAGSWCLARTLMSADLALCSLVLVIAMPGDYGPGRIFACVEQFLTPRMSAEAFVLAALAAAFSGRQRWGFVLLAAAFALHPVLAAAGAFAWLAAQALLPHPRVGVSMILSAGGGLLLAFWLLPTGEWGRINADWLAIVAQRSPYLFLSSWGLDDWSRALVSLAILIVGACTLESRARLLCRASALTMVAGLILAAFASDGLHLTVLTQMQPWRWQWLGTLLASLILPAIVAASWKRGDAARTTTLLSLAAWIFGAGEYALICALTAMLSLSFGRLNAREARLVFIGSGAILALAVAWRIASNLEFTDVHYMDDALPIWLRRGTSFVHDGFVPAALLCLGAWTVHARRTPIAASIWSVLGIVAIAGIAPFAWSGWTMQEFPRAQLARFAPWRDVIAPREEVFWSESPLSAWVLLNRTNYISGLQTSGMIFSRASALELETRAQALGQFVAPATFLSWSGASSHLSLSRDQLKGICSSGAFGYLVTSVDLGVPPVAALERLKLYACSVQARAAAAAT